MKKLVKESLTEDLKTTIKKQRPYIEIHYWYTGWESMDSGEYAMNIDSMEEAITDVDKNCEVIIKKDKRDFGSGYIRIFNASLTQDQYMKALKDYVDTWSGNGWKLIHSYEFEL
jgi:hypothetical protein